MVGYSVAYFLLRLSSQNLNIVTMHPIAQFLIYAFFNLLFSSKNKLRVIEIDNSDVLWQIHLLCKSLNHLQNHSQYHSYKLTIDSYQE